MIKLSELVSNKSYRAVGKYLGDVVTFEPTGYYEAVDDYDDSEVHFFGEPMESDVAETAASKYVGGCVLGEYSMNRNKGPYFIYEIDAKPDKDISHWRGNDFEYLQEVRYRRNVEGEYVGKVVLDKNTENIFKEYYRLKSQTEYTWDEFEDNEYTQKVIDMEETGQFQKLLDRIKAR